MIRKFKEDDVSKIVDLVLQNGKFSNLEERYYALGKRGCYDLLKDYYQTFLKYGEIFVYEKDGEIFGYFEALPTKTYHRTIYLHRIEVHARYRGKGIGREMMEFIEDYYKAKGYQHIILLPARKAVGFYEKLGYIKWLEFNRYDLDLYGWEFNKKAYNLRRTKIDKGDIVGRKILTNVWTMSEHILIEQERKLTFSISEVKSFGYINGKPFFIICNNLHREAYIYLWDLDILDFVLNEARIAGAHTVKIHTDLELDYELERRWFMMKKDI